MSDRSSRARDAGLPPRPYRVLVVLVVLVAAVIRLQGLDWDDGTHLHPDERYLTMVVSAVRFPHEVPAPSWDGSVGDPLCQGFGSCLANYWDTAGSSLNPANYAAYASYVYGTLPLFATRAVAGWVDAACGEPSSLLSTVVPRLLGTTCTPGHFLSYDGIYLVGRALSAAMDLLTLIALVALGRSLYSCRAARTARALLCRG
jgi:hypothetical protein